MFPAVLGCVVPVDVFAAGWPKGDGAGVVPAPAVLPKILPVVAGWVVLVEVLGCPKSEVLVPLPKIFPVVLGWVVLVEVCAAGCPNSVGVEIVFEPALVLPPNIPPVAVGCMVLPKMLLPVPAGCAVFPNKLPVVDGC